MIRATNVPRKYLLAEVFGDNRPSQPFLASRYSLRSVAFIIPRLLTWKSRPVSDRKRNM